MGAITTAAFLLRLVAHYNIKTLTHFETSLPIGPIMSFRLQPTAPARPNRCQLFGPGSRVELFAKMAVSAADVVNLDLEDSVAPSDKDSARQNVITAKIGRASCRERGLRLV